MPNVDVPPDEPSVPAGWAGRFRSLCLGVAAVMFLAAAHTVAAASKPSATPPAFHPERELHVPFEDLNVLIHGGTKRVLLSRDAYEELIEKARRKEDERAPISALLAAADYDITVGDERAVIMGVIEVRVVERGLHGLGLDLSGVGLRSARLDGERAALGRADDGRIMLFVEGEGAHELQIEAVMPLQTTAARQVLNFRLPTPSATRLRLTVPGDVEVRSGASLISRAYNEEENETRLEILPQRADMSLVMSLNSRLRRKERVVMARSVIVDEITEAYERLHATVSLEILHRAVRDFRFEIPSEFEVTAVESPNLSRWAVETEQGRSVLQIFLREDTTDRTVLTLSATRNAPALAQWEFPALRPLDTVGHVAVVGILLEDRLQAHNVQPTSLIPIDRDVIVRALPKTVLKTEADEAPIRPLLAYYAPQPDFSLAAQFIRPPPTLYVTGNTLLILQDAGLDVRGGLTILPREERLFAFDFAAPRNWDVTSVTDSDGAALAFERYAGEATSRIRVRLPRGIPVGRESNIYFTATHVPPGWLTHWESMRVSFPTFAMQGTARDTGAIAVDARDDMRVRPEKLSGVTPLDENEKARYGLSGVGTSVAYRYENRPFEAQLLVERIPPRLTAETYSFLLVKPDVLVAHYELVYTVAEARTDRVALRLPASTPKALAIRGLGGTEVKEYSSEELDGTRKWTAQLAKPERDRVHLALDLQMPLQDEGMTDFALPLVSADDVVYQSGLLAVEGSADLDVRVTQHPRRVDIGELADAAYQPGRRLLGAFGFVGEPLPVTLSVARRETYLLPPAIVQQAELATLLSADGLSQTSARFLLKSNVSFIEVLLPKHSTLWSVMLDEEPAKPQKTGDSILVGLPAGRPSADLRLVYETPCDILAFWNRVTLPSPRLRLYEQNGVDATEVPLTDLTWHLYMPTGHKVIRAAGTVTSGSVKPTPPAATDVAKLLYKLAGGIRFSRGLIGGCSAPLQMATQSARLSAGAGWRMSEEVAAGPEYIEEEDAFTDERPAAPPASMPEPAVTHEAILDKLESIVIPEIDFRQANIHDVIDFLQQASVEYDTAGGDPTAQKGMNVILNLGEQARQAGDEVVPLITFRARDISLLQALKIVTDVANLKYRIDGNVVMVVPFNAADSKIIQRMYDILPTIGDRIATVAGSSGDSDFIAIGGDGAGQSDDTDWKSFFQDMGVQWPQGASVKYIPAIGKLMVANTADNLAILEGRTSALHVVPEQPAEPSPSWALKGAKSLKIDLVRTSPAITFRSLGVEPELAVEVIHRRRFGALTWAVALAAVLGGLRLTTATAGRRASYVVGVLLVSTVLPALPGLLGLAVVLNGAFFASCCLVPYYLLASMVRRAYRGATRLPRRAAPSAVTALLVAALLGGTWSSAARDADSNYVVEMVPAKPADVPEDALLIPYQPGGQESESVLVPYDRFRELWQEAHPEATEEAPAAYALGDAAISAALLDEDTLSLNTRIGIQVYTDTYVEIPLPVEGAVLERAELDGAPARLRATPPAVQQQGKSAVPGPRTLSHLYVVGKGSHELQLAFRVHLTRQGGWRVARARLPSAPATALDLQVPQSGTEVILGGVADRTSYKTESAGAVIKTSLGSDGWLDVRWRPRVNEGEIDRSLTAESLALIDVQEDYVHLVWQLSLQFRRGEHEFFFVDVPEGYLVEAVAGPNVRGWEIDGLRLRIRLLQRAEERESFSVHLRRPSPSANGEPGEFTAPVVTVPEAIRHTGQLTIRRGPLLDIRALESAGARRTELIGEEALATLTSGLGESPLGIQPYQTYEFMSEAFTVRVAIEPFAARVKVTSQTILRVAERETAVESHIELSAQDRPVYLARMWLPGDMELDVVTAPGAYEWTVSQQEDRKLLAVHFAAGLTGRVALVIRGRLGETGGGSALRVPELTVLDAEEQSGDIVVQADPAFDVRATELRNLESVLMRKVHTWLNPGQRPLARLALHYRQAGYGGKLTLVPRRADVSSYSVTNIRVTDRAIEETVLFNFQIHNAGIRKVDFLVPGYLADARVSCPLLRQKTVTPIEGTDRARVELELQDEVMNDLRVLLEHDRLLTAEQQVVRLPMAETGRMDRRYLAVESAGRDEVIVGDLTGLEPLSRQQQEWETVARLWRGGATRAFIAAPGDAEPELSFQTKQRVTVETSGARIGLAQTLLMLDASGAYRASQNYNVDNQTEQFLEIRLPKGATLWTAEVAGELVKPVTPDTKDPGQVKIPLVKTAAGDLDYRVTLKYGGSMDSLSGVGKIAFPFIRSLNINVELSQVDLRLPRTHKWLAFDGTMSRITEVGTFEAGVLAYRNKLAKRLVRTLQYGTVFEKARAGSNLKQLKKSIEDYSQAQTVQFKAPNKALSLELSNASAILDDAQRQLDEAEKADAGEGPDNRIRLNEWYDNQDNTFARNVVFNNGANWDDPTILLTNALAVAPAAFNGRWLAGNSLENAQVQGQLGQLEQEPEQQVLVSLNRLVQAPQGQGQQAAVQSFVNMQQAANQPAADDFFSEAREVTKAVSRGKQRRSQRELAGRYQMKLEEQVTQVEAAEDMNGFVNFGATPARGETLTTASSMQLAGTPAVATFGGVADIATGLTSLGVDLPPDDGDRWESYRFTTPRGEVEVSGWTTSRQVLDALKRIGLAAGLLAIVVLLRRFFSGRRLSPQSVRAWSTVMIIIGTLGILMGVLPLAALVLLLVGIVVKLKRRPMAEAACAQ